MIFLEQTVNQILREEGQVIVSIDDLNITWEDLQSLFIGVFEQCKQYISIYDWTTSTISSQPSKKEDWAYVKHLAYNAYNGMQRLMPDLQPQYWEFNPYTKNMSSLVNSNFTLEVGKYPTLENLEYTLPITLTQNKKQIFTLPCTFRPEDFSFAGMEAYENSKDPNKIILEGNNGVGMFDSIKLTGYVIMDQDFTGDINIVSKYVGIRELDLSYELFYIWFKAALMCYIGSMKKQLDLTGVGLPFDLNADGLLERGRQLMDTVETLKGTKSNWSNF